MADEQDERENPDERQNGNFRPIPGFGLRYTSRNSNININIPLGVFRRLKRWTDEHWKLASWRAVITIVALFPTIYGISLGNMTIADKQRLSSLEAKAADYDKMGVEVKGLTEALRLKAVDFGNLEIRIKAAEDKITGYQELSESDGIMLLKQQRQERDRKRRRELEEHNKARADKLKKIGQVDELRADPSLPSSETFPIFKGAKND